jgi:hypothetical protein
VITLCFILCALVITCTIIFTGNYVLSAVGTAATVVISPPIGKWESPPITAVTPISMVSSSASDIVGDQSVNISSNTETVTSASGAIIRNSPEVDGHLRLSTMVDILPSSETATQQHVSATVTIMPVKMVNTVASL